VSFAILFQAVAAVCKRKDNELPLFVARYFFFIEEKRGQEKQEMRAVLWMGRISERVDSKDQACYKIDETVNRTVGE
jgi:hypothetical protein